MEGVVGEEEKRGEPQMEKEVRGAGDVKGGGNTEGLVNTALDTLPQSLSVPLPRSPSLYLDKNCEVVRFHLASQAHIDDFHPLNIHDVVQDDHMLVTHFFHIQICVCLSTFATF